MNVENILKVADAIEQHSIPGLGFNMADVVTLTERPDDDRSGHRCGTVACIAGFALTLRASAPDGDAAYQHYMSSPDLMEDAAAWLGLDYDGAVGRTAGSKLFFARGAKAGMSRIDPSQAVAVLRHLAATGEVDWTVGAPAQPEA